MLQILNNHPSTGICKEFANGLLLLLILNRLTCIFRIFDKLMLLRMLLRMLLMIAAASVAAALAAVVETAATLAASDS